jgi:ArsR family transcriptional regulator
MTYYIDISRFMESTDLIMSFSALAQPTRLDVFRLLVSVEPEGMIAGGIARHLAVPQNTLSSHLAILLHANLVTAQRNSRTITYRANLDQLRKVTTYLFRDCCGGRPEICAPLIEDLTPCCRPASLKAQSHV